MIPLSKAVIRMSTLDRTKQELNLYDGGIYLCTTNPRIARKIEEECQRRKIDYKSVCVQERSTDKRKVCSLAIECIPRYGIHKIGIHMSWKTTALEKKQLADWAVTTFNDKEGPLCPHDPISYDVWIQPSSDVMNPITKSEEEYEQGHETHWV